VFTIHAKWLWPTLASMEAEKAERRYRCQYYIACDMLGQGAAINFKPRHCSITG